MQIAPIPGIGVIPTMKRPQNDPMLAAVIDIESPFGVKQDSLSHSGENMPGGEDGEGSEQEETPKSVEETGSGTTVNFFA